MILVPAALPETRSGFRTLIDRQLYPQVLGGLTAEALPAGAVRDTAVAAESATVVIAGRLDCGSRAVGPGDGLYHPPGSRHRFTAAAPSVLLTVHARTGPAEPGPPSGPVPLARRPEDGALTRAGGFAGMGVHWLATAQTVGTRRLALATSEFTPGGRHDRHRHPDADEFFLVLSGGGEHLTDAGPVRLGPGDLAYVPAGEWHGYRTWPDVSTVALYGYLGAAGLSQAGYQVQDRRTEEAS